MLDALDARRAHLLAKVMVILPTYNEASNLPTMIAELFALRLRHLEILVVDDNSPDGTGEIAEKLKTRYPGVIHVIHRPQKIGLGSAYIMGFKYALAHGAEQIVQMDADFSHSPSYIPPFLRLLGSNGDSYDVIIGSRYVPGGKLDERWGVWRRFLSAMGNAYARWVTGVPIRDLTTGFKCFTREVLSGLNLDRIVSNGYAFQIEMTYACYRQGYRLHEEPIAFEDRVAGKSKMSARVILEAIWRVWQIRWRYSRAGHT